MKTRRLHKLFADYFSLKMVLMANLIHLIGMLIYTVASRLDYRYFGLHFNTAGGFWDVARHSSKPFIASHSNSRSITVHSRNITDVMIKTIAEKGGVIGLNFCPGFLGTDKKSSISHMLHHVKHIYEVGGEDVLALGTDLDGTGGKMQINSCDEMWRLKEALQKHRMPSRVIDKMWQNNALRVMKEIL